MIRNYIENANFEDTGFHYTLSLISGKHKMVILYCLMEFQGRATHFVKKFWPSLLDRLFYWYMSKEPDSPFK